MEALNFTSFNVSDPTQVLAALQALAANQQTALDDAAAAQAATNLAINTGWLLLTGALVFFMQIGFTALEAGSVAWKRSVPDIIVKNMATTILTALIWWLIGYGVAFGDTDGAVGGGNGFIGDSYFAMTQENGTAGGAFASWFFQFAFAAAAAQIVSGAVAERARLTTYMGFVILFSGFIYPVVAHWCWASTGWISAFNPSFIWLGNNFVDFAGSGVVHTTGGVAAILSAYFVGPRKNRFNEQWERRGISLFNSQDPSWVALGTFFLWFGWYGFNAGSTLALTGSGYQVAAFAAVTSTLSAAAGCASAGLLSRILDGDWDLGKASNGALAGLVAVTGGCAVVPTWASVIIGLVGGAIFFFFARLLVKLKIDDPVDASPLHLGNGVWGIIAVGLFAGHDEMLLAYGRADHYGLFLGGGGYQLAVQLIGILCILAWSALLSGLYLFVCAKLGVLRMSKQREEKHYEEHMLANKAEEGFASVVTFNKKRGGGKSLSEVDVDGDDGEEDMGDVASKSSELEENS